jgi:hypothetical protein
MADFTTPASNSGSVQDNAFPVKPVVALALAALADWLFYGQRIGISVVLFAIALTCSSLLTNFARLDRRRFTLAGILVLASVVPAVEEFNAAQPCAGGRRVQRDLPVLHCPGTRRRPLSDDESKSDQRWRTIFRAL